MARIVSMMVRTSSGLADDPSVPVLEAVLPSLKAGPVERKVCIMRLHCYPF